MRFWAGAALPMLFSFLLQSHVALRCCRAFFLCRAAYFFLHRSFLLYPSYVAPISAFSPPPFLPSFFSFFSFFLLASFLSFALLSTARHSILRVYTIYFFSPGICACVGPRRSGADARRPRLIGGARSQATQALCSQRLTPLALPGSGPVPLGFGCRPTSTLTVTVHLLRTARAATGAPVPLKHPKKVDVTIVTWQ